MYIQTTATTQTTTQTLSDVQKLIIEYILNHPNATVKTQGQSSSKQGLRQSRKAFLATYLHTIRFSLVTRPSSRPNKSHHLLVPLRVILAQGIFRARRGGVLLTKTISKCLSCAVGWCFAHLERQDHPVGVRKGLLHNLEYS